MIYSAWGGYRKFIYRYRTVLIGWTIHVTRYSWALEYLQIFKLIQDLGYILPRYLYCNSYYVFFFGVKGILVIPTLGNVIYF